MPACITSPHKSWLPLVTQQVGATFVDVCCDDVNTQDEAAVAAAARQMSGAAAGVPLPGALDEAPADSSSSSSSADESDDDSGAGVSAAPPPDDDRVGRSTAAGLKLSAQRRDGVGSKGKRRRGRHQGIQEL